MSIAELMEFIDSCLLKFFFFKHFLTVATVLMSLSNADSQFSTDKPINALKAQFHVVASFEDAIKRHLHPPPLIWDTN